MAESQSDSESDPRTELVELPPSAKLVVKALEYEGELNQSAIAEETRLSQRTVRHALSTLEDQDIVDARISFVDARQRIYSLRPKFAE